MSWENITHGQRQLSSRVSTTSTALQHRGITSPLDIGENVKSWNKYAPTDWWSGVPMFLRSKKPNQKRMSFDDINKVVIMEPKSTITYNTHIDELKKRLIWGCSRIFPESYSHRLVRFLHTLLLRLQRMQRFLRRLSDGRHIYHEMCVWFFFFARA